MRLIALGLLGITSGAGCGEDAGIQTPPIEEWCEIDRPREDCVYEEFVVINSPTPAEAGVLCETSCTRLSIASFNNATGEVLKALTGFESATGLTIRNADDSLRDLEVLNGFATINSLTIDGNEGLESLDGLENLTKVGEVEPDGSLSGSIDIIDNPKLKSVSALRNVEMVGLLSIHNNSSLTVIGDFSSLEAANIRIDTNRRLTAIRGFENLQDMSESGILIERNRRLIEFDAFENVTRLKRLFIVDNSSLSQCRAEAFAAQLENEPEVVEIEGNDTDCP